MFWFFFNRFSRQRDRRLFARKARKLSRGPKCCESTRAELAASAHPARASFLLKIRRFRGKFLLPALRAHILHMQASRHTSAPQADKGTGWERAGARRKPPRAAVGLQNAGPSPAFHLPTTERRFSPRSSLQG